jgi:ribosomal protein L12E/L44/L45/RPP1/RPP2
LNLGLSDTKEIDFRDLLKMTDKIGVQSTRHQNPDFIAKLENKEP